MPIDDITPWQHEHKFHEGNPAGERNTWRVVGLTAAMMVVEIVCGTVFHSMALLADGWHMATHVAALGIAALAYWFARRCIGDTRFAFGPWKIEVLGGFSSALALGMVAVYMTIESLERLWSPVEIQYTEALIVTAIGLAVNIASALLLADHGHDHGHTHDADGKSKTCDHDHTHKPLHKHDDLNLRAAYVHVIADALTSVLAIAALLGGKFFGWQRLDPIIGIVGAAIVGVWAVGLVREASRVLLDREMDHPLVDEIRATLEADGDTRVTDLHVWRVGPNQFSCAAAIVARNPKTPDEYRVLLKRHTALTHATLEVVPLDR
ncbi:MAG: CDF family Co(II)/Ni(II) efflux transporter DmeF [Planctomycetia bacterium]|nr:CDF family Co(II)/Ni(II) efflux transporter DmeF [Planctomycetia bacterium]